MGKHAEVEKKTIKDPQQHPISKSKTLKVNLNSYIRMLNNNFPEMTSKQYIKNVHRFIEKINRKIKYTANQQKLVEARQQIKICSVCDCWSGNKPMIQCNKCEDNYHISCLKNNLTPKQKKLWCCHPCDTQLTQERDSNNYLENFTQEDECSKCQK